MYLCAACSAFNNLKITNQAEVHTVDLEVLQVCDMFFLSKPSVNCSWSSSSGIEWKEQLLLGSSDPISPHPPNPPPARRHRPRRFSPSESADASSASINKPLADEDAHAVNICPRAVTLDSAPLPPPPPPSRPIRPVNSFSRFSRTE